MLTKVIACRHCSSDDVLKNGFAPINGEQKSIPVAPAGVRQSREDPSPDGYTEEREEEILRASYQEQRSSLRRGLLRRTFGVSPTTVIGWLKKSSPPRPRRHPPPTPPPRPLTTTKTTSSRR